MPTLTQAVRYQIIKPLNVSWDQFGQILRDLSYHTTKMCNAAVQLYWEWHNYRNKYKDEHGKHPIDKEIYGCSFRNHVYRKLREMYPLMASLNASQVNQFAMKRWSTDLPEIKRLQKSIPSFKLGTPIQVGNQNYDLKYDDCTFTADITLLGKEAELGRFSVVLDAGDKSKKFIFQRIIDGTYKKGAMQIVRNKRKNKWFCIISYSLTKKTDAALSLDRVMGVDLGVVNALYWAFNFSPKRGFISGGEIDAFRKRVDARRRDIQRIAGKTGHGRNRKLQPIENMKEKIAKFRDTINHKYSQKIIQLALANKCGVIQVEDLSGISEDNLFLKNWTYFDLQNKIIYKALREGIIVRIINPQKTSQTCSECGYVDPENREDQATFICKECGTKLNADYNAACNISKWPNIVKEHKPN